MLKRWMQFSFLSIAITITMALSLPDPAVADCEDNVCCDPGTCCECNPKTCETCEFCGWWPLGGEKYETVFTVTYCCCPDDECTEYGQGGELENCGDCYPGGPCGPN